MKAVQLTHTIAPVTYVLLWKLVVTGNSAIYTLICYSRNVWFTLKWPGYELFSTHEYESTGRGLLSLQKRKLAPEPSSVTIMHI